MEVKVALITGAAQRVGKSTAQKLHRHGYNIIIHYRHSQSAAHALAQQLNAERPHSAHCLSFDLNDVAHIQKFANDAIQCFGRIDALINNASSFYPTPVGSAELAQWDDLIASNMKTPFFLSQALTPELKKNRGCIINMVDIHAEKPLKQHTIYCMAKAGLVMMTKSLAKELAPEVRVNGVAPGVILWPPSEDEISNQIKAEILSRVALKKMGSPDDIAETIYFLLDHAPYITGQIINVDGGRTLNL
ncbi:MAG TPA: pteridine reductase [Pseudomonadales bacterium]|nr:pteridine reductase [Pseudomonadales bacterium]